MCVFALNFMFHCCALFFAFSCLSDEGGLVGEGWICHWWLLCMICFCFLVLFLSFFVCFLPNKHIMCAETRRGNDVVILSC